MTGTRESQRRSAAVASLYRIRAVESSWDGEGLKSVWHQTADGADLLSFVNREGQVVRQELSLLEDYFLWSSEHGLRTGKSASGTGLRSAAGAGHDVTFDPANVEMRVSRGAEALKAYAGEDRYIQHIARILKLAHQGMQSFDPAEVTSASHVPLDELLRLQKQAGGKGPGRWQLLAAGLGALVVFAIAVAMLGGE